MRGWTSVPLLMLLAGACAADTSSVGGTFTFSAFNPPSDPWWRIGSAYISLLAGASADHTPARGSALSFSVDLSPSVSGWVVGSANNNPYIN